MFFSAKEMKTLKSLHPNEDNRDLSKKCGQNWKILGESDKKKFITLAKKEKDAFE